MFEPLKKAFKWFAISFIVFGIIGIFLPSEPIDPDKNGELSETPPATNTDAERTPLFTSMRSWQAAEWPLTVSSGTLRCLDDGGSVVFENDEKTYAVNGTADSRGYDDINPIWKDNPSNITPKVNIGPLIDAGLELCGTDGSMFVSLRLR